ncbi:glutamate ligase [Bifidobacterium sp. UTCIF-3]|nr:glutamate ligase [Bifidobacterium sp. UTCIF-1]TPF79974.1 glutamate ligase [Bifidobacterium sp. UTCIF-24]TPF82413.1 glutamate ligase [Bifidobacterium sp. UTCIF-3]TPF83669.1 glutamate ligase [Bifidobacterium sp. UTCIF-36]TPF89535.1 glutamate ligase [Bifidobacterium sp. UTBIF-56]
MNSDEATVPDKDVAAHPVIGRRGASPMPRAPWYAFATVPVGRFVRFASRVTKHGGSALPGRIVESFDPGFLTRTLGQLPLGVVLVSGTNGKTTTTRMVASMLSDLGLKVFTNPTGSNFVRGVVSALLTEVTLGGKLDADIAVLELDEAYAVHFVRQVKPRYALLLNVMRDQLDRFGEIDTTARLLSCVAEATTGTVVLNREDPRIAALAAKAPAGTSVRYFGLADGLKHYFPSDDDMATTVSVEDGSTSRPPLTKELSAQLTGGEKDADVTLAAVGDHQATFHMDGRDYATAVRLEGVYNLYNAAAALAVVRAVMRDAAAARKALAAANACSVSADELIAAVARVTPAFGRGEVIDVNGSPVELLLVKNPMGFRLSLASFDPSHADTMIAINDEYADGRDMSWLWDVDFTSLRASGVAMVSGVRAWDMALRLGYDQVPVAATDPDLEQAVSAFVTANPGVRKHIYCTYTAMLKTRAILGRIADVRDAGVGK